MSTDTVAVDESKEIPEPIEQIEAQEPQEEVKEERVPLSAMLKERKKRQEAEQRLIWAEEQLHAKQPPKEDDSQYESATKADLNQMKFQAKREMSEESWIRNNPERAQEVDAKLEEFLKQRPNLASAINNATNRYEEAWELLDKLNPKQQAALKVPVARKDAPGSPGNVPKAAAINQTEDVMNMSDAEFSQWRKSRIKRR